MFDVFVLADFFSSLALMAALAWSYGYTQRTFQSGGLAQFFLGAMFGGIAMLQMFSPLEIAPGIIIDMRHVPVLLAGAYLGWRGALPCLAIAIAARVYVGGQGMESGIIGLIIATAIALGWHEVMRARAQRGVVSLFVLGCVGAARLIALIMIPPELAMKLLVEVFPILLVLETIALILIGKLMERELRSIKHEQDLQAAALIDPQSGFLTPEALDRAYEDASAERNFDAGVAVVLGKIRHSDWLTQRFGYDALDQARTALRRRLERELPRGDLIGLSRRGELVIIVFDRDAHLLHSLCHELQQVLSAERIRLRDGAELRIGITLSQSWGDIRTPLCQLVQDARLAREHPESHVFARPPTDRLGVSANLFGRLERMMR